MTAFCICRLRLKQILLIFMAFVFLIPNAAYAEDRLRISVVGHSEGTSDYYHELIKQSLKNIGYNVELSIIYGLPQKRYVAMFEHGLLDVVWLLESAERNEKFVGVDMDLTDGLLGKRVLMVPAGESSAYANIQTLDEFRKSGKIGVFGANWFDIDVWRANDLPYRIMDGDWRRVYDLLTIPRWKRLPEPFDYFSRGVSEILFEINAHPGLEVEPRLLFIYDRDFNFYLTEKSKHLKPILETGLRQAKASGLMRQLIDRYFSGQLAELKLDERIRLNLKTPE